MRVEAKQTSVFEVIRWLSSDACHDLDDADMISVLGRRLQLLGLPITRLGLHLRTLHPQIQARSIMWSPDEPVQIVDRESIAVTLPEGLTDWLDVYEGHQVRGFAAAPLAMSHGPAGVAVFATSSVQKFTSTAIEVLSDIVPALRGVCEIRLLRRTERTLLDTYVGPETGRRVLDGHIRRGDVETLRAALF